MLATVLSRAQVGMEAPQVCVEVHVGAGLPVFSMVGLPEAVVKESKDRVRSALATAHFEFPAGRITVNLAPADLPKEGGRFDLPIALGVLVASAQLPSDALAACEFYGELSLSASYALCAACCRRCARQAGRGIAWCCRRRICRKPHWCRESKWERLRICSRCAHTSMARRR